MSENSVVTIVILFLLVPHFDSTPFGQINAANWRGPDNNYPLNWNYSPQSVINEQNAADLQVLWTFPVPAAPIPYAGAEGAMVTPLINDGIVYTITNWHRIFALDARNGGVVWFRDLPLDRNNLEYLQPSVPGLPAAPLGHYHALFLTQKVRNQTLLWTVTNTYQVFALNALTGDIVVSLKVFGDGIPRKIPGNFGLYDQDTPNIMIDESRGILIFGPSVSEGDSAGRGFLEGWNVGSSPPKLLWMTFLMPPQDGSEPSWSLSSVENMTNAYIFNGTAAVDLKALPKEVLNRTLFRDWGSMGFNGSVSFSGMGPGWGGAWSLDEQAGLAYLTTSSASPDWNATYRPGPNLWSESVLSLNDTTGRILWAFQSMTHSLGDLDCSWNVVLANQTIGGQLHKVVYKGCKTGFLFALDATTGKLLWYFKPPSVIWKSVRVLDPLNSTALENYNWYGYPESSPVVQNPSDTGSLESDIAFDPLTNTVFLAPYNQPKRFQFLDVGPPSHGTISSTEWEFHWGVDVPSIRSVGPANTTIYSIDAATGGPKWSYMIQGLPYRGGLTVTGGVVYVSTLNGVLTMLREADGHLLAQKTIGGSLPMQPSIGEDANGNVVLVLTDMGSSRWGGVYPGFIQALGLSRTTGITSVVPPTGLFYATAGVVVVLLITIGILLLRRRTPSS